jgi:transposase
MLFIQPEDRNKISLYFCLEDQISPTNIVRIIDLFIDKIVMDNPDEFIRYKDSDFGAPAYMTSTLLKLYVYGCLNSITTSRKLENETKRNLELKWLLGDLHPDHWVISQFRTNNKAMIDTMKTKFSKFLRSHEYIDLKKVAIDGSKIKANTKKEMLTLEGLKKMMASSSNKLEEYLQQLALNDKTEDILDENETSGEAGTLNRHLLDKITKLEEQLEEMNKYKEKMESEGLDRISPTDEDAKLMKSRYGNVPSYNVQTIVDSKHHMIADFEVTTEENDVKQLKPMIESLIEKYGEKPGEALSDTGYYRPDDIEELEKQGIEIYVGVPKDDKENEAGISFEYNKEKDVYICSEGKQLKLIGKNIKRRNSLADEYQGTDCGNCPMREKCTKAKNGRIIYRYLNQEYRDDFKKKMKTKKGKEKMKLRKCIVEHPFGTIKTWMGKIQLLLRGKEKVSTEMSLWVTAYNFRRLVNIENFDALMGKIATYKWA